MFTRKIVLTGDTAPLALTLVVYLVTEILNALLSVDFYITLL